MNALPLNHYNHLLRLASLRRCNLQEAIRFLMENVDPVENNWMDSHFGRNDQEHEIDLVGYPLNTIMAKIQGLPRNIRPVTDGPYLADSSFFVRQPGLLGIEADGVKILDYEMATSRDRAVYRLVRDLLPKMTDAQYRIYNTFNSQYLRLVREPGVFTMPRSNAMAIDAGCYVGYKALAMSRFLDEKTVLAFEMDADNFEVLKLNASNNPQCMITPIRAALSDRKAPIPLHTRNRKTMAHSLTHFSALSELNRPLKGKGQNRDDGQTIETSLLDDYTKNEKRLSAVHISVNGHEPEVLAGGLETARKADILRVSCPYSRDHVPVRDIVIKQFREGGIRVFGTSFAAVIAGKSKRGYHVLPLTKAGMLLYETRKFYERLAWSASRIFSPGKH
jgi:FkbM family methyltransferase